MFACKIRATGCKIPLLLLTADKTDQIRTKALKVGITEVLSKENVSGLAARVTKFVQDHVLPNLARGRIVC